jgi:hypothetical protein
MFISYGIYSRKIKTKNQVYIEPAHYRTCTQRNRQIWKWDYTGIGVGSGPSGSSLAINPSAFVAARKLQQALATIIAQLERSR